MKLTDAQHLAKTLMLQHGLTGWSFMFDSAKNRFGCCNYTYKRISLSSHLVQINDEARVKNTILHEIAHALTPGHGHDEVWRRKAIEIGCNGERCYSSSNTVTPKANYEAICPNCKKIHKLYRLTRKSSSCGICSNTYNPNYKLVFKPV